MANANDNWQERLFRKSVVKQLKYRMIKKYLGDYRHLNCLDLGADNGVISYLLRLDGGRWYSADIDSYTVQMILNAVTENVYLIEDNKLPFADNYFDIIVIIDLLEHLEEDGAFISEISRVSKKGSSLIINVPHVKKRSITRRIRKLVGLTDEQHGHVRAGYTYAGLSHIVQGYSFESGETYSRGFTELIDIIVSLLITGTNRKALTPKGLIVGEEDLLRYKKSFILYSFFYPLLWFISKLDLLLFFLPGHRLIAKFKKDGKALATEE